MVLYAKNEDETDFVDSNGKKIEYTVEEGLPIEVGLLIIDDGHAETNIHIIAKPAENDNHVVVKSQVSDIVRGAFLNVF